MRCQTAGASPSNCTEAFRLPRRLGMLSADLGVTWGRWIFCFKKLALYVKSVHIFMRVNMAIRASSESILFSNSAGGMNFYPRDRIGRRDTPSGARKYLQRASP